MKSFKSFKKLEKLNDAFNTALRDLEHEMKLRNEQLELTIGILTRIEKMNLVTPELEEILIDYFEAAEDMGVGPEWSGRITTIPAGSWPILDGDTAPMSDPYGFEEHKAAVMAKRSAIRKLLRQIDAKYWKDLEVDFEKGRKMYEEAHRMSREP